MLVRSAFVIAEIPTPTPGLDDVAHLSAAALLAFGFIAMLRGQRLAIYALLLDSGAVVLLLLAAIALLLSGAIASEMKQEPLVATIVLLYAVLWSGATGAALSALWGSPMEQPRRAFAILVVGVALNALAFTLGLPVFLWGQFQAGTPLDLLWMLGMLAIGVSAGTWIEDRSAGPRRLFSRDVVELSRLALPAMTAVFAAGLVVVANVSNSSAQLFVDSAVATTMVTLALRAGLALYTNWRLSETERRRAVQFEALYEVGLAAAGEFEDVDRPDDVLLEVAARRVPPETDIRGRRQMNDRVTAAQYVGQEVVVGHEIEFGEREAVVLGRLEQEFAPPGAQVVEADDIVASSEQGIDETRSDEAGCARHRDLHVAALLAGVGAGDA